MIILLPILFPLITGLGFNPVWFGVIMVVAGDRVHSRPWGSTARIQDLMPAARRARRHRRHHALHVVLMIVLVALFVFSTLALWLPWQMMPGPRDGRSAVRAAALAARRHAVVLAGGRRGAGHHGGRSRPAAGGRCGRGSSAGVPPLQRRDRGCHGSGLRSEGDRLPRARCCRRARAPVPSSRSRLDLERGEGLQTPAVVQHHRVAVDGERRREDHHPRVGGGYRP